jgi:hypothetical protein
MYERTPASARAQRYYTEAAEAPLSHLNPAECMRLTERASGLLQQAHEGSFIGEEHLKRIQAEARALVADALAR